MAVDTLLIYSVNDALVYSEEQQFILTRKVVDHDLEVAKDARDNFIAGFTVGLILQLDIRYCIALGLIVFAAHGENSSNPDKDDLLAYTEKWIVDLNKDVSISLYQ
jgi:sugar/nucleoside kinase (ribokinase family)